MGDKSAQKRQLILDTARRIFAEKGYKDVTMKDIVEACGISRGGLYLYFDSTESLFCEVMKQEEAQTDDVFSGKLGADVSALSVLMKFFKEQKREILRTADDLSVAEYEYCFAAKPDGENPRKGRFEEAQRALCVLIEKGIADGEFLPVDAKAAARHMMISLEGLRITARTFGVTEEMVDGELLTLVGMLVEA